MNPEWQIDPTSNLFLHDEWYDLGQKTSIPATTEVAAQIQLWFPKELDTAEVVFIEKVMASVDVPTDTYKIITEDHDKSTGVPGITLNFGTPGIVEGNLYKAVVNTGHTVCEYHAVDQIMIDNNKKRLLWESLKTLFK
jgi:hypothetical protein